jgi:hypothetical protein
VFVPVRPFQPSLMPAGKAVRQVLHLRLTPVFTRKYKTRLERLARHKHSSLLSPKSFEEVNFLRSAVREMMEPIDIWGMILVRLPDLDFCQLLSYGATTTSMTALGIMTLYVTRTMRR